MLLVAVAALLPRGVSVAASWRVAPEDLATPRNDFRPGVVFRVPQSPPPTEDTLAGELALIRDLGMRAVNLFVHDDLMTHPDRADAVGWFVNQLRADGATIVMTADYPARWAIRPPSGLAAAVEAMAPFHAFLAETYAPDILVPVIEPYGAYVALTGMTHTPTEWAATLTEAVHVVQERQPLVRCAAYLGSSDNDEGLYRLLCRPASAMDVVGFSFYAVYQTRAEMSEALATVEGWMDAYGRGRDHWVFEFGQSPVTMGGERAQSGFVQLVAAWAMARPRMRGVCVFALGDHDEKLGLVNSHGRQRLAYTDYRAIAAAAAGPAPGH